MRLGVKAHWRDADGMAAIARAFRADTLEVVLAREDLHRDRERVVAVFRPLGERFRLVVHQPEHVGGLFVDPCAPTEAARRAAEDALASAAALTGELGAAGIVVHPGGVARPGAEPAASAATLARTLRGVRERAPGVPLWLENMPWFYGFRDGTVGRTSLGRHPDDFAPVREVVDGFCLDVCHAFLSEPPPSGGWAAVRAFLDAWGPDVRHAHASGAAHHPAGHPNPRSGEGVPFTEGDMDAAEYRRALARLPADAAVVPEIDLGFEDGGSGFRDGLEWLRELEKSFS